MSLCYAKLNSCTLSRQSLYHEIDHATINPWALRLMAVTSMTIWFTVAGSGRWIGFS